MLGLSAGEPGIDRARMASSVAMNQRRAVNRMNSRQGFLVSAIVHLTILMALIRRPDMLEQKKALEEAAQTRQETQRVFLPPREVLRQLIPAPALPRPRPRPVPQEAPPTPPPPVTKLKDKISIGAPSDERSKKPLILRKEDDLTAVPKGTPSAVPSVAPPTDMAQQTTMQGRPGLETPVPGAPGLRMPNGIGDLPRGQEGIAKGAPGERSIASSLRSLDRRLQETGPRGLPTGTGQQMGPLFFDPEGADFTAWINHFKNEVYKNWIVPQSVMFGFRGHVDIAFTVERNGTISELKILKGSGTPALDKAAQFALEGSRFLPLPADYGPPRVTMQVTFFYNEGPEGS